MAASSAQSSGAGVVIRRLEKRFGAREVLRGVELEMRPGEVLAIVGPSGSGKSTLLRVLGGLEAPTAGSVHILDADGSDARGKVRVVFQEPRLLPWRSVLANVCVGMPRKDFPKGRAVLERVGLRERLLDYPGVLSGGQRQRVALARALVHEPRVLLLDEPFAALDALTRIAAQRLVESLWIRHGFSAVLVTHDVEEAVLLADRVLVLDEGRVQCCVPVELPRPRARHLPEVARLSAFLLQSIFASSISKETWLEPADASQPSVDTRFEGSASHDPGARQESPPNAPRLSSSERATATAR